jgi:hypothetical protein
MASLELSIARKPSSLQDSIPLELHDSLFAWSNSLMDGLGVYHTFAYMCLMVGSVTGTV